MGVEVIESKDGKVPGFMFMMSGLDLLYNVGSGPIRGMLALNGVLYVVSGNIVAAITSNGKGSLVGTIGDDTTPVSMLQNTKQLLIIDGTGAWLLPGGYPLVSGVASGGSLYAVGDFVVLQAINGGTQSAYPQIKITSVSNNPVTAFAIVNPGTAYTTANNVGTVPIQPQVGTGKGLQLAITTGIGGSTATVAVANGGTGYDVGDTGALGGTAGTAGWWQVIAAPGGVVSQVRMINPGYGYSAGTLPTVNGAVFPPNTGVGLTFNLTASGTVIDTIALANGGQGFQVGNAGAINSGSGDATYLVTAVGGNGVVFGFSIIAGGAISALTTGFTQQSTTGSGQDLIIADPTFGSFLGLVPITMPFNNPVVGTVIDGFGLAVFLNQQQLAQSNELDLSTWDPLAFGVADESPDNNVSLAALHDEAYIFKERNTEVWADQGTSPFAYGPLEGVHIEFGCCAPFSPAKADNDMIWLSRNDQGQGLFIKASAYAPQVISTQALVNELQKYTTLADCIAYSRQEGQHTYYVATFPSANVTWCYDKTTSELVGYPIWTKLGAFLNGKINRHWGNAFTTWSGGLAPITTMTTYQAQSVSFTNATVLDTAAGLNGLPEDFSTCVFSAWVFIPDVAGSTGIIFGSNPGILITIQNDSTGSPQITVQAWDINSNPIVFATYDFIGWATWVNILMSINTATQQLQVWVNTLTVDQLVENQLTPVSITWSSSNPIGGGATPWQLGVVS